MIRGFFYWLFGSILTFFLMFFTISLSPFLGKDAEFPHKISRLWSRLLLSVFCGVKLSVIGIENIDLSKNYIIVSNHRSYTDIFIASWSIPLQFRWLAKSSLFRIPLLGLSMKIAGYIPIVREKSISASKSLGKTMEVLKRGRSVWIFPEGTRTPKDVLGNFKRGAFLLAKETAIPILPVVLINSDKIFRSPFVISASRIKVIVYKPVYYRDLKKGRLSDKEVMNQMADIVRHTIQTGYYKYAS